MSFVSWQYPFFLLVVAAIYWLAAHRVRIYWLLTASYLFYGVWDARFLALLMTSTIVDYFGARAIEGKRQSPWKVTSIAAMPLVWLTICAVTKKMHVPIGAFMGAFGFILFLKFAHFSFWFFEEKTRRKAFLGFSICSNIIILCFFKYFIFFADSAKNLLANMGIQAGWILPNIILPIGISFYTFQTIAYVMDVYRKQQKACEDLPTYAAYLAFFPQLLAGPIGRAPQLMPQWQEKKIFSPTYLHDGLRLILIGLFKKIFVADSCALLAKMCFDAKEPLGGAWSLLGILAFTFQIYGDFSGYTDMARGSAKLFGFDLMINFKFPYLAKTPSEFWKRWHISLSSWFRDYVYIPLGGNRCSAPRMYFNLMATMLLAGLWHGAGNMFIGWGAYYGALLIFYRIFKIKENIFATFILTMLGWAIFRSSDWHHFSQWACSFANWTSPPIPWQKPAIWLTIHIAPLLLLQFLTRKKEDESALTHLPWPVRGILYLLLFILVISSSTQDQEFIYFQF